MAAAREAALTLTLSLYRVYLDIVGVCLLRLRGLVETDENGLTRLLTKEHGERAAEKEDEE